MLTHRNRYSIRVGRSDNAHGPYHDKDGKELLKGGGTIVYGSNHGTVYAPGGLGVLPGKEQRPDILYYHYLSTKEGLEFKVRAAKIFMNCSLESMANYVFIES